MLYQIVTYAGIANGILCLLAPQTLDLLKSCVYEENEYLYDMLKSEEHTQENIVSQLSIEKRARRATEKKAHDAEFSYFQLFWIKSMNFSLKLLNSWSRFLN